VFELNERLARYYAGHRYVPEAGKRPFLVRALFSNYTGSHTVKIKDGTLVVVHRSLGRGTRVDFSPLVVNLATPPTRVLNYVFSAQ
jgi:hypothetical protein